MEGSTAEGWGVEASVELSEAAGVSSERRPSGSREPHPVRARLAKASPATKNEMKSLCFTGVIVAVLGLQLKGSSRQGSSAKQ